MNFRIIQVFEKANKYKSTWNEISNKLLWPYSTTNNVYKIMGAVSYLVYYYQYSNFNGPELHKLP